MFHRIVYRVAVIVLLLSYIPCQSHAINTSAGSAILIEQRSGRVLYEQNADEERLIASITKIMTAVVAIKYGSLDDTYTVTAEDMVEGSSMYLQPGDVLTLEELLYGLLLASGNDAALAIAHCVSGELKDFVALMNTTARELGMTRSSFANPNGLDADGHYSTAREMALLASYAMENETFCRIVSTSSIMIGDRYLTNHNKLLSICEGCIGIKTGFTKAAGRTLVSAVHRDHMTLICVTLKDSDDWNDHKALYNYGYTAFRMKTLVPAGQKLAYVSVKGGLRHTVMLASAGELSYPVADGEVLTLQVEVPVSAMAPIAAGQVIGTAYACLDGQRVASIDLVAMEAVSETVDDSSDSLFRRFFHL